MYEFKAELIDSNIVITTNTYWSCKAEGNFKLSKYDGSGDTTINIEIPKDIITAEGTVYFSFGDERCEYPTIYVYINNLCYTETSPSYTICDDEKTIYFQYEEPLETFNVSIICYSNWDINDVYNVDYIINNNEVMIITGEESGGLSIIPQGCGEENIIYVKLIKKADQ